VGTQNTSVDMTPDRALLAAMYGGDGAAVLAVLTGDGQGLLRSMPQLAGDGLVCALAQQLPLAEQLVDEVAGVLRQRDWDGDAELADQIDPACCGSRSRAAAAAAHRPRATCRDPGG
jgi:hypothetical protein